MASDVGFRSVRAAIERGLRAVFSRGPRRDAAGPVPTRAAGERGEALAVDALRRNGFRILERNFRTPVGEIDVVAEEGELLCFVEVKWRSGREKGHPAEAVTPEKQRRLARAAEWYLSRRRLRGRFCRFDVVAIVAEEDAPPSIELLRDAFRGPFPARRRV